MRCNTANGLEHFAASRNCHGNAANVPAGFKLAAEGTLLTDIKPRAGTLKGVDNVEANHTARVRACQPSGVFTQLIPHVSNHACTRAAKLRRASVGTRKLQQKQCAGVRPAVEFLAVGASVPLEVVLIVHHEAGELGFKRLPRAPESACDGAHVSAQSGPREKLSRRENMSMEGRLLCVRQEHSAIRTCGTAGRPNHQMVNVREHLPG